MRYAFPVILLATAVCTSPAHAENRYDINIPGQRLDLALITLGGQARISIGGVDARLSSATSKSVRGRMSISRALQVMLRKTGFEFVAVDDRTVRIVAAVARHLPPVPVEASRPTPTRLAQDQPDPDIIVTASKQEQGLDQYPGSVRLETIGSVGLSENSGTGALVARLPTLASTNLGPGRNKIFVQGIADSSFSGPTQSTVGLYLGELRLTYNAPEPDLRLYDIDRIEVLEGPQGTLYGAGALGGIVRIIPNAPATDALHISGNAGFSATEGGGSGFDIAGTINAPFLGDAAAIRATGYKQIEGGYIANGLTGTRNSNRSKIEGGRVTLRVHPGNRWTVDIGGVIQNIGTRDGQYAERGLPPRTHNAQFSQPFDNDFKALNLVVMKTWDHLSLVSSTGIVEHDLSERFDATGYLARPEVLAYDDSNRIRLITHETRFSHKSGNGATWVAGFSMLDSIDRLERSLGPIGVPSMLATVRNTKTELAVFGEATQPVTRRISATLGARIAYARTIGEVLGGVGPEFEPRRSETRILPTAAISWKPRPDVIAFLRYQTGFRSGGIAISGGQINTVQRFDADEINTAELGLRFGDVENTNSSRFSGGLTGFFTIWKDIQADLIGNTGLPFTDNIGRGRIFGLEANARWQPAKNLTLDGAFFLNDSALVAPALGFEDANEHGLPNIAKAGGRFSVSWEKPLSDALVFKLNGTLRYIGRSSLGTTAPLILEQGEYAQVDMSTGLDFGKWRITLDATNLLNVTGNSFSYGNPFSVGLGQQVTPVRPRTFRIGAHIEF